MIWESGFSLLTFQLWYFLSHPRFISKNGLEHTVGLLGLVSDLSLVQNMDNLLENGISRVSVCMCMGNMNILTEDRAQNLLCKCYSVVVY